MATETPVSNPSAASRASCWCLVQRHVSTSRIRTKHPFLIFGYVTCLVLLARLRTAIEAGILCGNGGGTALLRAATRIFWGIFKQVAIPLWGILAFWIGLFTALTSASFKRLGATGTVLLAPFLLDGTGIFPQRTLLPPVCMVECRLRAGMGRVAWCLRNGISCGLHCRMRGGGALENSDFEPTHWKCAL